MSQIVMPVTEEPSTPRMQVNIHVLAEVIAPEVARRRANVWLLEQVGNLLQAETPELLVGERLLWRTDVRLTTPHRGVVGRVGRLTLDALTGEVLVEPETIAELQEYAGALSTSATKEHNMTLGDLTSRDAVLRAIAECDRLGRDAFLDKYGFGRARSYFLDYNGRRYDSKAVAGVAYGYQFPADGPLKSLQFSGGDKTVKAKLEELGFEVRVLKRGKGK